MLNGFSIESCIKEHERPLMPAVTEVINLSETGSTGHEFIYGLNRFYFNTRPNRGLFGEYISFLESYSNLVKPLSEERLVLLRKTRLYNNFSSTPETTLVFEYYKAFKGMFNKLLCFF
jgi:hypothetical protein